MSRQLSFIVRPEKRRRPIGHHRLQMPRMPLLDLLQFVADNLLLALWFAGVHCATKKIDRSSISGMETSTRMGILKAEKVSYGLDSGQTAHPAASCRK